MELFEASLTVLLAVAAGSWTARAWPNVVPMPLIQAAFGACISFVGVPPLSPTSDALSLMFLSPLLFWGAWRIPHDALLQHGVAIVQLSLGLLLLTVLGLAPAIHWFIPGMTLPIAFALAAALASTDTVAVCAIAEKCSFPRSLLAILRGEAVLNDAAGLVCLRFAIAAAIGGQFSILPAAAELAKLAVGGILVGAATAAAIVASKNRFSQRFGEDAANQILIGLLVPFLAYLIADRIHVSAILAVVSSGLMMNYAEQRGGVLARTRIRRQVVWGTINATLNGMLYVVLGAQFPSAVRDALHEMADAGYSSPLSLCLWVASIMLGLFLIRLLWVTACLTAIRLRGTRSPSPKLSENWRAIVAGTLGGVRGAVTFAGILTLPTILPDGSLLPYRSVCIVVVASTVIATLLLAEHLLPAILGRTETTPDGGAEVQEASARAIAAAAGVRAIERARNMLISNGASEEKTQTLAKRIAAPYRERLLELSQDRLEKAERKVDDEIGRMLMDAAFQAERNVINQLQEVRAIDQETCRRLIREVELAEAAQSGHANEN